MPSSAQLEWKRLPGHLDLKGRAGHTATLVGRRIFVLGGRHGNECFNDVWVFDTVSETWQQLQPAPFCPRAYHTATLVAGNQLWVIGGNDLRNMLGDVHVLDTTTLKWSVPATKGSIANKPRGTHAAIVHPVFDKGILVFGGFGGASGTWLSDLSILHTDTSEWRELTPKGKAPGGRGYHTLTALGAQVALFGGKGANGIVGADTLSIYDAVENTWTSRKALGKIPSARASHKATLVGSNQMLVHGGRSGAKRLSDTCVLRVQPSRTGASSSYRWHVLGARVRSRHKSVGERLVAPSSIERPDDSVLPEGRAAHSLLSNDRDIYIFGGYGGNGIYFSDIYVMQGIPELPGPGEKRVVRPGTIPARPSKYRRLVGDYEAAEQMFGAGGWRSARQRRVVQLDPDNERAEEGELHVGLTHPQMNDAISVEAMAEWPHVREDGATVLAANRSVDDRLITSSDASHHICHVGTSVTLMQAQEAENRKLRSDLQTKDEEIVSLQRELANLRSTTDQRVRDFECEIESLHSRLQANEMRTIALENENGRMVETVQRHMKEIQNKDMELAEASVKLKTSEEGIAIMQKSLEELTKTNFISIQERDELKSNVQRLEMELHKGAQNHEQTCIAHERERTFLQNEAAQRRATADRLLTELGTVKESARSLQETLDLLAKQLERESLKADSLQKENEELKSLKAALSEDCLQISAARSAIETAKEVLRADLQTAQALNHQNDCEIHKLKTALQDSKEQITALHASRQKDSESLSALQTGNEKLRKLVQDVEDFEQAHAERVHSILEKLRCAKRHTV